MVFTTLEIVLLLLLILMCIVFLYVQAEILNSNKLRKKHPNNTERLNFNPNLGSTTAEEAMPLIDREILNRIVLNIDLNIKERQLFHIDVIPKDDTPAFVAIVGKPDIGWGFGTGRIEFEIIHTIQRGLKYYWKLETIEHMPNGGAICYNSFFKFKIVKTGNYSDTLEKVTCDIDNIRIRSGHMSDIVINGDAPKGCIRIDPIEHITQDLNILADDVRICKIVFGR